MQQPIQTSEEQQAAKKPYEAPELINHGSVEELTESIRHDDQGGSCLWLKTL
jgi:hypothetical protein